MSRQPRTFGEVNTEAMTRDRERPAPTRAAGQLSTAGQAAPSRISLKWSTETYGLAKAAYLASLSTDPNPAGSFKDWIARTISEHADRTPARRAQLTRNLATRPGGGRTGGAARSFPVDAELITHVDQACAADLAQHNRVNGRTGFAQEAVSLAITAATAAAGGHLEPYLGRLPRTPIHYTHE